MAQLIPVQRQKQILNILLDEETAQVSDLARRLEVSELTIRRDLEMLSQKGLVQRSFGGASLLRTMFRESDYDTKAKKFAAEKRAVGKAAADLVQNGDIICINSGSTTCEVIRAILESEKEVTLVTNNIGVFPLVNSSTKAKIIFTGGVYRIMSRSVSGSMSLPVLEGIYAGKAFIGVDGFSLEAGLTTPIEEEALTTKCMIDRTIGQVWAVFASDKIGAVSNYKTCGLDKIHGVVTDSGGRRLLGDLKGRKLEIIFA